MKRLLLLAFASSLLLMAGCSSTKITSTWKAPDAQAAKYGKLMVVGIVREADRTLREKMESHLLGDLKALGYNAVSAYQVYGPKAFENLSEEQINEKLQGTGVDAVITIVLLDKQKERLYVPGRWSTRYSANTNNRFSGYYRSYYNRIEMPGYYQEATKYFWESNLYDLGVQKLLYSLQTQSFDPVSTEALAHEYGRKIVQNMVESGMLVKQATGMVKGF